MPTPPSPDAPDAPDAVADQREDEGVLDTALSIAPEGLVARLRSMRDRVRRWIYRAFRRLPLDRDLVVLGCDSLREFGGSPWAVQQELERAAPGRFRCVWLAKGAAREGMPPGIAVAVPGSVKAYRLLARAGTIIQEGTFPREIVARPEQTVVQIPPGTPIQREALDLTEFPVASRKTNFARLLDDCDRWTLFLSPNHHTSEFAERAHPAAYEIVETGSPRWDAFHRDADQVRREARARLGVADGQTLVVYAPVARDYWRDREVPVPLRKMAAALPEGHVLAVRAPVSADWEEHLARLAVTGRVLDAGVLSVEATCLAADVLVTDYSSIMVDYACLDRPIVLFLHEEETFDLVRGSYFDLDREGPGVVVRDLEGLRAALGDGLHLSPDSGKRRRAFRERFCSLDDGDAARRAVQRIFPELSAAVDLRVNATIR